MADFHRRAAHEPDAEKYYREALALAQSRPEKQFLRRRIAECSHDHAGG